MSTHPLAGLPAPRSILVDLPRLLTAYYTRTPDLARPEQRVAFGTSGHRGSSLASAFTDTHIAAITQAVVEYRAGQGISGPLYLGRDTHGLSAPAHATALEVLAANGVDVIIAADDGYVPTPVLSHAILAHNRDASARRADGVVITPSHNPPEDGGYKYNPPHGGPADTTATGWIEKRANALIAEGNAGVRRIPHGRALAASTTHRRDYVTPYVAELGQVVDMARIAAAGVRIGVDPLGGSGIAYWAPIAERYRPRPGGHQPLRRRHVLVHDRRQGRPHPHGLLLALRHGQPGGPQGPLRRRGGQRLRLRPPRHRHAVDAG
jgi:phosphoglucomutase